MQRITKGNTNTKGKASPARIFSATKLLLAIVVFSFLASGMAAAQNVWKGKFQLNEGLRWGNAILSPGAYSITIESTQMPMFAVIRSASGKVVASTATNISNDSISKNSVILVAGKGIHRQVQALNLPQLGLSLEYQPVKIKENEEFSDLQTETVAVR